MPPDDRLVADEDEPVLRMRPSAWSMAPGTTSDGPWSPPIASTATRTPARSWSAGRGPGCVTASAGGVVGGGWLQLDREAALVVATVRADVMRQLHLVAVRALLERRHADGEVRAPLALAGMRDASLGYTHEVDGLLRSSHDAMRRLVLVEGCRDLAWRSSDRRRSVARIGPPCQVVVGREAAQRLEPRVDVVVGMVVDALVERARRRRCTGPGSPAGRAARSARPAGSPRGPASRGRARGGRSGGRRRARRRSAAVARSRGRGRAGTPPRSGCRPGRRCRAGSGCTRARARSSGPRSRGCRGSSAGGGRGRRSAAASARSSPRSIRTSVDRRGSGRRPGRRREGRRRSRRAGRRPSRPASPRLLDGSAASSSSARRRRRAIAAVVALDRGAPLVEHRDALLDALERLDHVVLEPDQDAHGVLVRAAPDLVRVAGARRR